MPKKKIGPTAAEMAVKVQNTPVLFREPSGTAFTK